MNAYRSVFLGFIAVAVGAGGLRGDEAAVRETLGQYIEAFNGRELNTLRSLWTEDAVHVDRETGQRTEGRESICDDIETAFAERPEIRLAGNVDEVRLITSDVARAEGTTRVGEPGQVPAESAFTAIVVRDGERWRLDSIEESSLPQSSTPATALAPLEWFVGEWVDRSGSARVETTVRWSPGRSYLQRSFVLRDETGPTRQGTQIIGWDPRSRQIRSWTFNSDGSFGDGIWSESGDRWLIRSTQTLSDGRAASGTFVLSRLDDNSLTLQLIGHEIEGEPQPTREAVTVERVTEPPSESAAEPQSQDGGDAPVDRDGGSTP